QPHELPEQPQAARPGPATLPRHLYPLPAVGDQPGPQPGLGADARLGAVHPGLPRAGEPGRPVPLGQELVRPREPAGGVDLAEGAGRPQRWQKGRLVNNQVADSAAGWADRNNLIAPTGSLLDGSKRLGPCPMNCTNDNELYSFHPAGVNAVFADGSVHLIRS